MHPHRPVGFVVMLSLPSLTSSPASSRDPPAGSAPRAPPTQRTARRRLIHCFLPRGMPSAAGESPALQAAPEATSAAGAGGGRNGSDARPRRSPEELEWGRILRPQAFRRSAIRHHPLEVLHACYTKASLSAPVDNPKLVAWSQSVADLINLECKE